MIFIIENVLKVKHSLPINRNEIIVKDFNDNFTVNGLLLLEKRPIMPIVTIANNRNIIFGDGTTTYVFDSDFNFRFELSGYFLYNNENKYLTSKRTETVLELFEYEDNVLVRHVKSKDLLEYNLVFKDDHVIAINYKYKTRLLKLSSIDFSLEWEFDVSEISSDNSHPVHRKVYIYVLGVKIYSNLLIVPLSQWGLIGLDIESGEVVWKLNDVQTWISYIFENRLYGVSNKIYEIDVHSGILIKSRKLEEVFDFSNERIRDSLTAIQGISISERYIIFGNKGLVHVIDRKTFNLMETIHIDATEGVHPCAPMYKDGYLYVVDCDRYLHILKDESYKESKF